MAYNLLHSSKPVYLHKLMTPQNSQSTQSSFHLFICQISRYSKSATICFHMLHQNSRTQFQQLSTPLPTTWSSNKFSTTISLIPYSLINCFINSCIVPTMTPFVYNDPHLAESPHFSHIHF